MGGYREFRSLTRVLEDLSLEAPYRVSCPIPRKLPRGGERGEKFPPGDKTGTKGASGGVALPYSSCSTQSLHHPTPKAQWAAQRPGAHSSSSHHIHTISEGGASDQGNHPTKTGLILPHMTGLGLSWGNQACARLERKRCTWRGGRAGASVEITEHTAAPWMMCEGGYGYPTLQRETQRQEQAPESRSLTTRNMACKERKVGCKASRPLKWSPKERRLLLQFLCSLPSGPCRLRSLSCWALLTLAFLAFVFSASPGSGDHHPRVLASSLHHLSTGAHQSWGVVEGQRERDNL